MKKIPTLFKRIYENHKVIGITDEVTEGCEFVLEGKGTPTVKYDGSCCAIIGGELYKRYDAKKGKKAPEGAIPCQDAPDEITGHFPHWVKCDRNNPADKWFFKAYQGTKAFPFILPDGTYEAIGEHFQGNPYNLKGDKLVKHGEYVIYVPLNTFEKIKFYLKVNNVEGIVFWLDGEPRCKIKKSDFGFEWGVQIMTDKDMVRAAECCLNRSFCSPDCPLIREYASKGKGVTTCLNAFCNYITGKYSEEESQQPDENICDLQTITDNLIAAAKMVKQKTKRETPMQVCTINSNGKMLYSCPNCKARITVSSQTAYCDCCGQKLSFGGE